MSDPARFEASLWSKITAPAAVGTALTGALRAEVAIVGAGFTGLFTALHLLERGRKVAVLEAHEPGYGASGRNAGGCVPMWLNRLPSQVEQALGTSAGERLNRLHAEAPAQLRDLVERYPIACDLQQRGAVIAAHNPTGAEWLTRLGGEWNARGGSTRLASDGADSMTGGTALVFDEAITVNPLALARGLAAAVKRLGGEVFVRTPALSLDRRDADWSICTPDGLLRAQQVIVATEGYEAHEPFATGLVRARMKIPFALIASDPHPDVDRILPAGRPIADTNRINPIWLMATGDKRLVASLLPPRSRGASLQDLSLLANRRIKRLIPDLPDVNWAHYWEGDVALARGGLPRLLDIGDGAFAPGGYCGQGILPSLMMGRELAGRLCGEADVDIPVDRPRRMHARRILPILLRQLVFPIVRAV